MAEKAVVAFGRYLKLLRERRKLSLDDVVALTKAYPEPINKGYLSRAERGLSHIAFSKIVALGRAYEVPVDVFGEKLSLDLEVERLKDAPETEGRSIGELMDAANRMSGRGLRLHAYAIRRELLNLAGFEPVDARFESRAQQIALATLGHGVAAGLLSRHRLSLHEVEYAIAMRSLGKKYLPGASIQLSVTHRRIGDLVKSRLLADLAIGQARESGNTKLLADAYFARAMVASRDECFDESIELYKNAFAVYRDAELHAECSRTMSNLADAYVRSGRLGAARRTLDSAERIAKRFAIDGIRSRTRVLRGQLESTRGDTRKAVALWLEALEIAKQSHDRDVAFCAEFQLFKHALAAGKSTAANALGRRLNRLWPWVAPDEPDVAEFRVLWERHRPSRRRSVAAAQHDARDPENPSRRN